jgi:tRNA A37 threonylcarbamoyladenosine dehydratase
MNDLSWLSRTELLIGKNKLDKLQQAHVLIVGMGGVGSFAAEFICRAGVGQMTIVDGDLVDTSNRNRQLPALATTLGQAKVEVMGQRLLAINPELKLTVKQTFITPELVDEFLSQPYDYVIDAIDSLTPKLTLICAAKARRLNIISSMGAGGKLDPTQLKVVDISKTYNCPFAQFIRRRLRKLGISSGLKVVFSPEVVIKESLMYTDANLYKKSAYGTISYLPAAFGGVCASVVIRNLLHDIPTTLARDF